MNIPTLFSVALATIASAIVLYKVTAPSSDQAPPAASTSDSTTTSATPTGQPSLPKDVVVLNTFSTDKSIDESVTAVQSSDDKSVSTLSQTTENKSYQDSIDVLELGKQPFTDVSFRYWVSRLRDDPLLLQSALTEYLENRDTPRARHLAAVLAEVNTQQVLDTAMQLARSSDIMFQQHGLQLLSRLQPHNTHARNSAIDLLATQTDPSLLVATLNVFATPAQVVSSEQRQLLLDHAQLLTTHENANVRAHSISIISKWSKGGSGTAAATIGLSDPDTAVRARAAAALIGTPKPADDTKQELLMLAANRDEVKANRQLALYALSKMQLSESDRMRYEALEVEVRRTRH